MKSVKIMWKIIFWGKGSVLFLILFSLPPVFAQAEYCSSSWTRGDTNSDIRIDITDAVFLLSYLFLGGDEVCLEKGDVDGSTSLDITDALYLLNFLFKGGPAPIEPRNAEMSEFKVGFFYIDPIHLEEGIEIPLPISLTLGSLEGEMKDCVMRMTELIEGVSQGSETILFDTGVGIEREGRIIDPFEWNIGEGMEINHNYLLKVECEDLQGRKAFTSLKIYSLPKAPQEIDKSRCVLGDRCCVREDGTPFCLKGYGDLPYATCEQVPQLSDDPRLRGEWREVEIEKCNAPQPLADSKGKNVFLPLQVVPPPPGPVLSTPETGCCEITCSNGEKTCAQTYPGDCESLAEDWTNKDYQINDENGNPMKVNSPGDVCQKVFKKTVQEVDWNGDKTCDTTRFPPRCVGENACSVESLKIIRDPYFSHLIPSAFRLPRFFLNEERISQDNVIRTQEDKIPSALDENHHYNKPLGLTEGFHDGYGYRYGYGFVVIAHLAPGSKPEKCFTAQFQKVTVLNGGKKSYVGFHENVRFDFDYLISEQNLREVKNLRDLSLPYTNQLWLDRSTISETELIQLIGKYTVCAHEGNVMCFDTYSVEDGKNGGSILKGENRLVSWPWEYSDVYDTYKYLDEQTLGIWRYFDAISTGPKIVWYDLPGKEYYLDEFKNEQGKRGEVILESFQFKISFVDIAENEGPVVVESGDGEQVILERWVCELKDVNMVGTSSAPQRVRLEGDPGCTCYPQRKRFLGSLWERVKGSGHYVNKDGFTEYPC